MSISASIAIVSAGLAALVQPEDGRGVRRIDLAGDATRRVVVDREPGQYLGHVSTVLLPDGQTILAVYPKSHGGGEIVLKRSEDGGRTWSERLPTPESWKTSKECPSIHRIVDATGKARLIVWSGLFPARCSLSEDDGKTWTELAPAAMGPEAWGGIVVMSSLIAGNAAGTASAWFHDDGRFFREGGKVTPTFTLFQCDTADGGRTWSLPRAIYASDQVSLCEPGAIRSPDGSRLVLLLREESRRSRSHWIESLDQGRTWGEPTPLAWELAGDKHTAVYAKDGRLVVSFRDHRVKGRITGDAEATSVPGAGPWEGDWVAWVGTFDDMVSGRPGQYLVRLMDNTKAWDCAYPGLEVLPDGTLVATTYGHWDLGEPPYIVSVRFGLEELDAIAGDATTAR